jgi:hypothetical protein
MDQQCCDKIGRKDLSLQTSMKMLQRQSTNRSHCCCNSVHKRNLHELGAIPIKCVPNRLQRRVGRRYKISLLMADHSHNFHGMTRTRICHLFYHTISRRRKISRPEIWATRQEEEGERNVIRSVPTGYTEIHQPSMENNTRGCRMIQGHR